ncbi:MAG: GAF domain-containing protein [Chloroflexota bacterium]
MRETTSSQERAAALEREIVQLREQAERDRRALTVLYNVSLACRGRTTPRAIFEAVHRELEAIFQPDACYIALCDARQPGIFRAALIVDEGLVEYEENTPHGELTGLLVRERAPLLFYDLAAERGRLEVTPELFGNVQRPSRAWLGVPLLLGEDALGVISVQSYTPGAYDQSDLELLQRVGDVIAVALENANLVQQQRELSDALARQVAVRTEELDTLSALAAELILQRPLAEMLEHALRMVLDLTGLAGGTVRRLDRQREELVLLAQVGLPEAFARIAGSVPVAGSMIGRIVTENRPLVLSEGARRAYWSRLRLSFESLIGVPLRVGERIVGVLVLLDDKVRGFDQQQIDLVQAIGNQIALAIENAALLEERERQVSELSALSRIAHAAVSALDLPTLLRQVLEALAGFMRLDAFAMFVYDPQRRVIVESLGIDEGEDYTFFRNMPPVPGSLTDWVIRHRQTLAFRNMPAEIGAYPELRPITLGVAKQAISWIGTPLFDREDRVIGTIAVQSYTPDAFDDRDERFLASVARQVALHVQNVTLLTRRERQIRELNAIGRISQQIAASFDLDEMLRQIYITLQGVTGASSFYLVVCAPETHRITHSFFIDGGEEIQRDWPDGLPPPGSLTDYIIREGEPLLFNDIPAQAEELQRLGVTPHTYGSPNQPRSWAGVPLLDQDARPIGVIVLQDGRAYQYDQQTLEFLAQVASHLSLGIQKVQLFEQRERQIDENATLFAEAQAHAAAAERKAKQMTLVHRVTLALTSRMDPREILELACQELVQLFFAEHAGIVLFDEDGTGGTVVAEYPPSVVLGSRIVFHAELMRLLIEERRPIVIESVATSPLMTPVRDILQGIGIESIAVIPLVSRGRTIGSIGIDSIGHTRSFGPEEQELFMTVAASVAAAFENARLFAAEQEARRTADTLREVARALSASFDPREVLQTILRELQHVIEYDTASIMLLEGQRLRTAALRGFEDLASPANLVFQMNERSGAGLAVHRRSPVLIPDTDESPFWARTGSDNHVRSWLGVPLIAKGQVLGVLNIDSRRPNRFTTRDMDVAEAFASQAAVALENARLYAESVARVEQELEIAHRIQSNLFPRSLPDVPGLQLAAQCLPARETGGDFYDCFVLGDPEDTLPDAYVEAPDIARGRVTPEGPLLAVMVGDASGKSIPGAMLMAVARSVARSEARDHVAPPAVMRETNRWVAHDVPHGTFVALSYATLDPRTRRLAVSGAGQLAPLLRRADGSLEYLQPEGPTLPLGIIPDVPYRALELTLAPGDTLVFYTDGVVEAHDATGQLFGFERLEALLAEYGDEPPAALIDRVLLEVGRFSGNAPHHDDMTLVVIRVDSEGTQGA